MSVGTAFIYNYLIIFKYTEHFCMLFQFYFYLTFFRMPKSLGMIMYLYC